MIINAFLSKIQKVVEPFYSKSTVLKNIDRLIFVTLVATIVLSSVVSSDAIGCFAIVAIMLTIIKLLTKPYEKIALSLSEKYLFMF